MGKFSYNVAIDQFAGHGNGGRRCAMYGLDPSSLFLPAYPVVLLLGPVVQGLGLGWVSAVLPLHRE